ncbi:MAG TPA: hypothetical protein VJN43_17845 [Bryobacteraceae bacterium]|nr:hypothetical protein [Bryobacteraceae bacterium]
MKKVIQVKGVAVRYDLDMQSAAEELEKTLDAAGRRLLQVDEDRCPGMSIWGFW